MKSIRRRISLSMRRSRSNLVEESISEIAENGIENEAGKHKLLAEKSEKRLRCHV